MVFGSDKNPAFNTKTSHVPIASAAVLTAAGSEMSTTCVVMEVLGYWGPTASLVSVNVRCVRPRMAIDFAPADANAETMPRPIPWPPPVMTMDLPAAESSGREGEMEGYVLLCHVAVRLGKRGGIFLNR